MKIHHVRNATLVLEVGEHKLIVDPALGDPGSIPAFKMAGGGRRPNPLVPLPPNTEACLDGVTAGLITHAHHADHLDRSGASWLRERGLQVWASALDSALLRAKELDVREVVDGILGMRVEVVPALHGRGVVGWLMGPGSGFYLAHPGEPSLYLTGDAVLTDDLLATVERLRPDVIVAPAGAANFGVGPDVIFSVDELIVLARRTSGELVFNHLEALDHCPTTRAELRRRLDAEGLSDRTHVPEDGESLTLEALPGGPAEHSVEIRQASLAKPGFQKWLVDLVAKVM